MRPSPRHLAKGFLGRSVDEFKRLSTSSMFTGPKKILVTVNLTILLVLKAEGLREPTKPYILASFRDSKAIQDCKAMSDKDIGGFSTANLDWVPPSKNQTPNATGSSHGHAKFHGNISIELPINRPEVHRTGYAAWRTKDKGYTIFGKTLWDIDPYEFLALRIKSDGRKYFINLQTESIVPTDIHQHRLYAKRPGEWETLFVPWTEFVRTNHGVVVEPQREMLRQSLRTIGIGLTDRVPGNFELCIERMWATNEMKNDDSGFE
ncbi:complex I intermediate associated protein (Cia30) [Blumeria hordei DH14]|uniref:Complex I intermediate associated protein (Cia30) n=1 Tax=Blumeria graminis f. sp. hordei (strain DH14) TaxID=546991 RepID=N1JIH1_BLUG1|nr:complex I intermediate associated protein (Cia30) [Blumeria hordei DH14]